jgi:hypothetical protein
MAGWWAWLFPFVCGAPWMVAIVYYWRRRPRDGAIPMSTADRARQRLWLTR